MHLGKRRGMLEQRCIVPFDRLHAVPQLMLKRGRPRKPAKARDMIETGLVRRQSMGLRVFDHLQSMLHHAQKVVAIVEFARGLLADVSLRGQPVERFARPAAAQLTIASAQDELLRLNEKLDLADAAASELDVMPGDRNFFMTAMDVDLPLD